MEPDVADGLECGKLIDGRYRLDRVTGQGAFGIVYEAHHLALDTRVAIKVMRVDETGPPRAAKVAQFLSEARTSSSLRHPAIVRVLDAGVVDGKPYFVMEWCDGPTLKAVIAERGPSTVTAAWALLEPVFEAIAFAHRKGVVHRDIKPSNVVMYEGSARVIDFGIAKLVSPDETPGGGDTTTHGQSPFTPSYASPEQLAGARTGPWTDVYALALLFIEVVTGSAPGPTPRGFGANVGSLEPVLTRALAARPADRYPDAGELTKAVREALVSRRRWVWLLAALPALVCAKQPVGLQSRRRSSPCHAPRRACER
jgi:serine/threonine-protein kinase